tara:strand:+ start:185 stop:565 length:381 start_codon:yes stop_codon:yes gene_type:complete
MEDDTNVIQGPWKPNKKNSEVKKQTEEDMAFIEELTEKVMVQLIHTMSENQIDIQSKDFSIEIGFINESVKSMLYREFGYPHPVTRMIQTVVSIITDKEKGVRYTNFDTQKMVEILTMMTDEWDDE